MMGMTAERAIRNAKASVEMEGFAIAYAARRAGIPFIAYKFVSDGKEGHTTDKMWADVLDEAKEKLHRVYEEIKMKNEE